MHSGSPGFVPSRGFTLIEVMVTVMIVAIVASVAYPTYERFIRDDDTEVTSPRSRLVKQNLEIGQDGKRVILTPNPVNWATQRGW